MPQPQASRDPTPCTQESTTNRRPLSPVAASFTPFAQRPSSAAFLYNTTPSQVEMELDPYSSEAENLPAPWHHPPGTMVSAASLAPQYSESAPQHFSEHSCDQVQPASSLPDNYMDTHVEMARKRAAPASTYQPATTSRSKRKDSGELTPTNSPKSTPQTKRFKETTTAKEPLRRHVIRPRAGSATQTSTETPGRPQTTSSKRSHKKKLPQRDLMAETMDQSGTGRQEDDDDVVENNAKPPAAAPTKRGHKRKSVNNDTTIDAGFIRRSTRPAKPTTRFGVNEEIQQPQAEEESEEEDDLRPTPDMFLVSDIPDNNARQTATHWVQADRVYDKPKPRDPYVYCNGTTMPGNSFEELWTVAEQDALIPVVKRHLARHNGEYKNLGWSSMATELNAKFNGVVHAAGTQLAEPYQLEGVTTLARDREYTNRSFKDIKERAKLVCAIINPNGRKTPWKPQTGAAQSSQGSRTVSGSSSLSSVPSSDLNVHFAEMKIADKERAKWCVDNLDEAPDNQDLRPKLPKPRFNAGRGAGLLARFVEGGPCYICKATKSCDKWHSSLYMKRPVAKATAVAGNGFNRLDREHYEWYCSECFQSDCLRRKVIGAACDVCGTTETIDRFETHMFMRHDDAPRRICNTCYNDDYNERSGALNKEFKKMHDEWNGKPVDQSDTDGATFGSNSINIDVDTNIFTAPLVGRSGRGGAGGRGGQKPNGRANGPQRRQPISEAEDNIDEAALSEGETSATIDDETLLEPDVSMNGRLPARGQRQPSLSSGPDEVSQSPRLARGRQAPTSAPGRGRGGAPRRNSFDRHLAAANSPGLSMEDYISRESSVVSSATNERVPQTGPQAVSRTALRGARRAAPATMVGGRRQKTTKRK